MARPDAAEPESSSDDLQLPDLLLAAAFGRRPDGASGSAVTEVAAGVEVGGYRILHRIGSGGMGTVYAAEQSSPRRKVALKLLSPSRASKAMVHRFQREARLLGSLQHVGIAQVHEAGSVRLEGLAIPLHYLVLELVSGEPLDQWASSRELTVAQRLELVARVCDAVQHAHQRGVLHRDLKPGNVLVVPDEQGGCGQPKVLDFGVARALEEAEAEDDASHATQVGQLVGTLAYMSPEQAGGYPFDVDTRSDVYALGVILFRLLTGALPVDVAGVGVLEAARRLRDCAPARPSTLAPRLDGELDTIVLKALAKPRAERYASAAELAADLRRYLRGEPIHAREHSALYVLRKAIRRNPAITAAALALVVSLIAFALVASWQARRNRLLALAESAAREALGETAGRLATELRVSNLDRARLFSMAGNLLAAEDLAWRELVRAPDSQDVLWSLRDLYRRFPNLSTQATSERMLWSIVPLSDRRGLVTLGFDGSLRLHEPPGYGTARVLLERAPGLQRLVGTPDAGRLVRFGGEGQLDVIDGRSLELVRTIPVRAPGFDGFEGNGLELDAEGRVALVALQDGRLRAFDLERGALERDLASFDEPLDVARWSPSRALLAVGGSRGSVWLVDPRDGRTLWSAPGEGLNAARLEFSPDERQLFAGGRDRKVRVFDVARGAVLAVLDAPNGSVRQIEVDPDRGRALVSGWWSLDAWELSTWSRRVLLSFPTDCFARLPAEGLLVTSGQGQLKVWEQRVIEGPPVLASVQGRTAAFFLGDGKRVAVGDGVGRLRIVATADGRTLHELRTHGRRIRALSVSPDGRRVYAGGEEEDLVVVDAERGEVLARWGPAATLAARSIALGPDGARVAYASAPETVEVRDGVSGELLTRIEGLVGGVNSLTWLSDGRHLALAVRPRSVRLFDLEGVETDRVELPADLWALQASPDGSLLAASTWGGDVLLLDPRTLEQVGTLAGHSTTVWDLVFRPVTPAQLLTAAGDGSVRLWDLASERCVLVLDELEGWEALSVDLAADARTLVLAGSNGWVKTLDLLAADRCIAGNLDHQLARLEGSASEDAPALRERILAGLTLGR